MSKVVGIGETVIDFIIRNGKPEDMVCGGSCYNSMISIGRCGLEAAFVGETGDDKLGLRTKQTLEENGVSTEYLVMTPGKRSQLSLAFLNEKNDAEYVFYKDHASDIFPQKRPSLQKGDVLMFGSFYALNPLVHTQLSAFTSQAKQAGATIYYDINFRSSHLPDLPQISNALADNLAKATIVRGSDEDFQNIFGLSGKQDIYNNISPYCPNLIITRGGRHISLLTRQFCKDYTVAPIEVISTVGAGDSFNAGIACSLISQGISRDDINSLPETRWDDIIATATSFAREVCQSTTNYISFKCNVKELKEYKGL